MRTPIRLADTAEEQWIRVNEEMRAETGTDESHWTADQVREYVLRLDAARIEAGWVVAQ